MNKIDYCVEKMKTILINEKYIDRNEKIVFRVKNCVLIEKFTGKNYSYRAVNFTTGEKKHLYSSKKLIDDVKSKEISNKIMQLNINKYEQNELEKLHSQLSDESINKEIKANMLLNHIFTKTLPEYKYKFRENQFDLANDILKALQGIKIAICEANVGIGKTHAYILATIVHKLFNNNFIKIRNAYPVTNDFYKSYKNMPILISTSSITLQKAIVDDYIPSISEILMEMQLIEKPLSVIVRKGKEHYICDKRLDDYAYGIDKKKYLDIYKRLIYLRTLQFSAIDLDEISEISSTVKNKICVSGNCSTLCAKYEVCRYRKYLDYMKSYEHDIQICNHNYLIADCFHRRADYNALLPNYSSLVIDEAHKLIEVSQTMYQTRVCKKEFLKLKTQISQLKLTISSAGQHIEKCLNNLLKTVEKMFGDLQTSIPSEYLEFDEAVKLKTKITDKSLIYMNTIVLLISEISMILNVNTIKYKRQYNLLSYVTRQLRELKNKIRIFQDSKNIIYWIELDEGQNTHFCAIPKDVNRQMYRDVWNRNVPMVLTSGTLSVDKDFTYIMNKLGLDLVSKWKMISSIKHSQFNYMKNCFIYINNKLPFPDARNPQYISAIADEIYKLIYKTNGHTLILFTSYIIMGKVFEIVQSKIQENFNEKNCSINPNKLFKSKKLVGNPIETFKESGNGVLFATGNCWEGIDISGDTLSSLVIVKLPFPMPDPLSEYERTLFNDDKLFFEKVIIPQMVTKLKQGAGRLIRSESDTGVISILDSRMNKYKHKVLSALPECRVSENINDVEEFIKKKKTKEYFGLDYTYISLKQKVGNIFE